MNTTLWILLGVGLAAVGAVAWLLLSPADVAEGNAMAEAEAAVSVVREIGGNGPQMGDRLEGPPDFINLVKEGQTDQIDRLLASVLGPGFRYSQLMPPNPHSGE